MFIVIEGIDRCGKSTQCKLLAQAINANLLSFPDRSSLTGKLLDRYLSGSAHVSTDVAHLLFSANRWERAQDVCGLMKNGNLVVDRYILSGLAYSVANGLDREWCEMTDRGLPEPDLTIRIDVPLDVAASRYDGERHDNVEFQRRVLYAYQSLDDKVIVIDGNRSVHNVHSAILDVVNGYARR